MGKICAGGINHGCEDLSLTCNRPGRCDRPGAGPSCRACERNQDFTWNAWKVGRLALKGQAWDSARSYVVEVEMPYLNTKLQWIEAMKNGNTRFRSEAQRLPGVNYLDKDAGGGIKLLSIAAKLWAFMDCGYRLSVYSCSACLVF
jgi:hypothetical protein